MDRKGVKSKMHAEMEHLARLFDRPTHHRSIREGWGLGFRVQKECKGEEELEENSREFCKPSCTL